MSSAKFFARLSVSDEEFLVPMYHVTSISPAISFGDFG